MKLMYESEAAHFEIEEFVNESTGLASKKYKIKGVFSTPGQRNKNGRIYPVKIWEEQVARYQDELKKGTSNTLLELEHPPREKVLMMEAVAKMDKLYIQDGLVMGEATLLNNPKSNQLKSLIDAGITMAVSSRGVGKVGQGGLVESFKLITFDIIPDQGQSDHAAEMQGIVEGVLMTEDFDIDENNNIVKVKVCGKKACMLANKDKVDEAILEKFEELFGKSINEAELPLEIKRLSLDQLIYILDKMVKSDKTLRASDLISVLKSQEDKSVTMTNELFRKVYSEKCIQNAMQKTPKKRKPNNGYIKF